MTKRVVTPEVFCNLFNRKPKEILAIDFLDAPNSNLVVARTKDGKYIRFDLGEFAPKLLERIPFEFCGFWHYPASIINMDEKASGTVSAATYLPSRPLDSSQWYRFDSEELEQDETRKYEHKL
jgi:hypothetical protein